MKPDRAYHLPVGNPCKKCGLYLSQHWVSHNPTGYLDCKCGVPYENHKVARSPYIVGIDGEGQGRQDHKYMLLAYANGSGSVRQYIEAKPGERLTSEQCLDFILAAPKLARFFSYAFNYDLTKILTDVDDRVLYLLFRPELRPNKSASFKGPRPISWNGYSLNLISTKFVVEKGKKRAVIWDIFKFFQTKFTQSLTTWKVASKEELTSMRDMKDKRDQFDLLTRDEIRNYCFDECQYMAVLAEKLIQAHNDAGLKLRSYFGAGSTSGAILKKLQIDKIIRTGPSIMDRAVACAFFGGRFEHDIIGEVEHVIYGKDISSAYPYQLYQLPCLGCGSWEYTKNRKDLDISQAALVNYSLGPPPKKMHWGPFPFRTDKGAIVFPSTSGGGWIWKDEYIAGEKYFPHVQFKGAWVYRTDCQHKPFAGIAKYYIERLKIGKEGKGQVYKLGVNGGYGKLAQSVGDNPPFQSWIYAGMTTSGCRAQMLDMMGLHKDWSNILAIATDGMYTLEKVSNPVPIDTGTFNVKDKDSGKYKPLGGWEEKTIKQGMFFARPGIYFPLNPSEDDIEAMRARGVGRKSLYDNWKTTVQAWRDGVEEVEIKKVSRFHGAKTCISRGTGEDGKPVFKRSPLYGQWTEKAIGMSFDPLPKRELILPNNRLKIRSMPRDLESAPYSKSIVSDEARALKAALIELLEQPDGDDYSEYEGD